MFAICNKEAVLGKKLLINCLFLVTKADSRLVIRTRSTGMTLLEVATHPCQSRVTQYYSFSGLQATAKCHVRKDCWPESARAEWQALSGQSTARSLVGLCHAIDRHAISL